MIIAETTCDGKKKAYEIMQNIKPIHVMHLPHMPQSSAAQRLWLREIKRLNSALEENLETHITGEALQQAITETNREQSAFRELFDLNQAEPPLLTGMEMVEISSGLAFSAFPAATARIIKNLVEEISALAKKGYQAAPITAPRILLTGTPVGYDSSKVIRLAEECGGVVVAMETCGGYKTVDLKVDENPQRHPLERLAEKYLRIPCSIITPNEERFNLLEKMCRDFNIQGVIEITWHACHTYNIESYSVSRFIKETLQLPYLHLETDFSTSDHETLRVRIETFMEMIVTP